MGTLGDDVRTFVKDHVLGNEPQFDNPAETPPLRTFAAMHERGLLHWWIPESCGGRGTSITEGLDATIDLAYGDAGLACNYPPTLLGSIGLVPVSYTHLRAHETDS